MGLEVALVDFKVEIEDVGVKDEDGREVCIEAASVLHDLVHDVNGREWLIHKVKYLLLHQFILNDVVKNQENRIALLPKILCKDKSCSRS